MTERVRIPQTTNTLFAATLTICEALTLSRSPQENNLDK
jgi:hypothetical protein